MVTKHVYSLTEAAEATGMTRQGVLAAIRRGTVSAKKNAQGQWEIDPAELHRVYAPVNSATPHVDSNNTQPVTAQFDTITDLQKRLAVAEALLETTRNQRDEALRERDAWKQQSHEWMMMTKALPEANSKRGFFSRIFSFSS
ncbi:hypothetical protein [Desulfomicrobium escambiense]|uniref:hypothetical protein n=1 Tax=Desulfomicrobium escambiense TaxID=29503 RepID=UPI00048DBF14|nr:hypothetical protein [Desulfomicrobium escambiense]